MKKTVLILMIMLSFNAWAEIVEGNNCATDDGKSICHWEYDDLTKTLTVSGLGSIGGYTPPEYEGTFPPMNTRPWHKYSGEVKNIVIGEGITSIKNYAFAYFPKLEKVKLPDNLQSIHVGAFAWTGLKEINIPDSLLITAAAFRDTHLTDIVFGDKVMLANRAFQKTPLEKITISDSIMIADETVFDGNVSLKEIYCDGNMSVCQQKMANILSRLGLQDKIKWRYTPKRIYTIEEANQVAGKVNSVKIRYR